MAAKIDQQNKLAAKPFDYQMTKDKKMLLYWLGKQVKILTGQEALKLEKRLLRAKNESERQLYLAKVTGNFKRGNER